MPLNSPKTKRKLKKSSGSKAVQKVRGQLADAKQATKKVDTERKRLLTENRELKKGLTGGTRTRFRKARSANPGDPLAVEWAKVDEETTPGPEREAAKLEILARSAALNRAECAVTGKATCPVLRCRRWTALGVTLGRFKEQYDEHRLNREKSTHSKLLY